MITYRSSGNKNGKGIIFMFEKHIQDFVEARIEGIHISDTYDYRKADVEIKNAKAELQPFFTDAKIGNRLLEEFNDAAYRQAIVEIESAYRQGFTDGMQFTLKALVMPVGRGV